MPCLRLCEVDDHADGALDAADDADFVFADDQAAVLMTLWMMFMMIRMLMVSDISIITINSHKTQATQT